MWGTLKTFMKEKCKLKRNTSNAAGQFGFGMSAAVDSDFEKKIDEAYTKSMANFSAGHANITTSLSGLQNIIAQQQQQLLLMQQQMAANAYAPAPQYAVHTQANSNNGGWTGQHTDTNNNTDG